MYHLDVNDCSHFTSSHFLHTFIQLEINLRLRLNCTKILLISLTLPSCVCQSTTLTFPIPSMPWEGFLLLFSLTLTLSELPFSSHRALLSECLLFCRYSFFLFFLSFHSLTSPCLFLFLPLKPTDQACF